MEATEEHPVCRASDRELWRPCAPHQGEWQSLAESWSYRESPDREWQVARIQEASRNDVRLALDYSLPGVPTRVVTRADLNSGASLRRRP